MKLITEAQRRKLLANEAAATEETDDSGTLDMEPVVRLFDPLGRAVWLLVSIADDAEGVAFGLCDLGLGFPELGYVVFDEFASIKWPGSQVPRIERDRGFRPRGTLRRYWEAALTARKVEELET